MPQYWRYWIEKRPDPKKTPDRNHGDKHECRQHATTATVGDYPQVGRLTKLVAEEMGKKFAMQLRADREKAWIKYNEVDGDVTTQGWLDDQGSLWWNAREKIVAVNSPMLIPENSMAFMIKGIVHRQSSTEGTTTSILLCRSDGLGSGSGESLK
jgi:hypothetical protein